MDLKDPSITSLGVIKGHQWFKVSSLQLTMAYAYWKSGKTNDIATFDLYFRCVVSIMNIILILMSS